MEGGGGGGNEASDGGTSRYEGLGVCSVKCKGTEVLPS